MPTKSQAETKRPSIAGRLENTGFRAQRVPPEAFFVAAALFHYIGPALAFLLFSHVGPLGVAWLRITAAALIFAVWCRPWRFFRTLNSADRRRIIALGIVLAAMNSTFYLAIEKLPLATVGAIEFLGPIILAAIGLRGKRNTVALALAVAGTFYLTKVRIEGDPLAYVWAFANCALFMLYISIGHRIAADGGGQGVNRLAAAMLIAAVVALPVGIADAAPAFTNLALLGAGIGVGICSSVIPYSLDQLAMSRLPRATYALMLTLLPATATVVGTLVLHQIPTLVECTGIALIIAGIAIHRRQN